MPSILVKFVPLYGPGDAGEQVQPFFRVYPSMAAWDHACRQLRGAYASITVTEVDRSTRVDRRDHGQDARGGAS